MSENDNTNERKKIRKKHERTLETQIDYIGKTEKEVLEIKDKAESTLVNLNRSKTDKNNELDFVKNYPNKIINLNEENWQIYGNHVNNTLNSEATVKNTFYDVKEAKEILDPIYNTSVSGSTTSHSGNLVMVEILKTNYIGDSTFIRKIEEATPVDDFWDNVDYIKNKMDIEIKSSGTNFYNSIKSFFSAIYVEKGKRLMDIRQAIFDDFFDMIVLSESMYANKKWFKEGVTKALRHCQTKHYILTNFDYDILPDSVKTNINRISQDMQNIYDNLSNWGHTNASRDYAEYYVKREVLPTFKNVFDIKI